MEVLGILSGGAPVLKKFQVSATVAQVGIPLLAMAAGEAGLNAPATTAINDMVGINIDLATFATAQQADGSSPEGLITVIINPDAILKVPMSGGAASGVSAVARTVSTASTTGLVVTTGDDWNTTDTDEGQIWGVAGANAGQIRKITSTGVTAATVTVAFAADTVVGDSFSWAPISPMTVQTITLTTELDEFRQDLAVASNTAELTCIGINPNNWLLGTGRPYAEFLAADHVLNRES